MQLVLILLAASLGLTYGYNYFGFVFSSKLCLFAGITLIMPSLFEVKLSDIKLILEYKYVILKSLLTNYILLPIIALAIGLMTHNFGIAAGLFLLSVLSGGGMVMNWIKKSHADTSIGFILLLINLIFVSLSFLMLHIFGIYTSSYFDESYLNKLNMSAFANAVIILLIVIPFILSRIIILIKPLKEFIQSKRSYISNISIFLIVFYLFALQSSQYLFDLYDFEPELITTSIIAVIVFYILIFIASKFIYNFDSPQEVAAFWHTNTRYITLALVIATFSTGTFGVSMLLPIMFAYIVQVPFAANISKYIFNKKT